MRNWFRESRSEELPGEPHRRIFKDKYGAFEYACKFLISDIRPRHDGMLGHALCALIVDGSGKDDLIQHDIDEWNETLAESPLKKFRVKVASESGGCETVGICYKDADLHVGDFILWGPAEKDRVRSLFGQYQGHASEWTGQIIAKIAPTLSEDEHGWSWLVREHFTS